MNIPLLAPSRPQHQQHQQQGKKSSCRSADTFPQDRKHRLHKSQHHLKRAETETSIYRWGNFSQTPIIARVIKFICSLNKKKSVDWIPIKYFMSIYFNVTGHIKILVNEQYRCQYSATSTSPWLFVVVGRYYSLDLNRVGDAWKTVIPKQHVTIGAVTFPQVQGCGCEPGGRRPPRPSWDPKRWNNAREMHKEQIV